MITRFRTLIVFKKCKNVKYCVFVIEFQSFVILHGAKKKN